MYIERIRLTLTTIDKLRVKGSNGTFRLHLISLRDKALQMYYDLLLAIVFSWDKTHSL